MAGTFILCLLGIVVANVANVATQKCDDIDTLACKLLVAKRPNMCSDTVLSKATCPRFCNLCPVECYHCNATVMDYHDCNTTILCNDGQVCMRKELKSFHDGHHEYQMTCAEKHNCDGGSNLTIPFGKRYVESRDISITCCADDLCNYPVTLPTGHTGRGKVCLKDIVFMVDQSSSVSPAQFAAIFDSISEIAKRLDIGTTANLVAVYGYDQSIHTKIALQQYTDKVRLLSALHSKAQFHGFHHYRADTSEAVKFLVGSALTPTSGDRPAYPDAVVIFGNYHTARTVHVGILDRIHLQRASQDVISVVVGGHSSVSSGLDQLATDRNHVLDMHDSHDTKAFVDAILPLLQKC